MHKLSSFENDKRKSMIYEVGTASSVFVVYYYEDGECITEKEFLREWEAEMSAENFVLGHIY